VDGPSVRKGKLLREIRAFAGLYAYDVYGGLMRRLEEAGGYRPGETLFALEYDWRTGIADAAVELERFVEKIGSSIDLVAVSTGGVVARRFLMRGGSARVRRVIYVGSPQRGTFDALAYMHLGFRCVPGGKRFSGAEIAAFQTSCDVLPHASETVFVDGRGDRLELDLFDVGTWRELGLGAKHDALAGRLTRAREVSRALATPFVHPDSFVIGARHLRTPARVVVENGRAFVPPPKTPRDPRLAELAYAPGDGTLPESSLLGLAGLDEARTYWVKPVIHRRLLSDPEMHRLVVEILARGKDATRA
jgi:hypothetical protein